MAEAAGRTEQEERCEALFAELGKLFKRIGNTNKPEKIHAMLKDITAKLKEAKTLIKDFEREARADGVPPAELAERRKALANELNMYIAMKKNFGTGSENRSELLQGAGIREDTPIEGMTTQQLISHGRKEINEIDQTLSRAERLVEDTKNVGKETALTLHGQSTQLNKVVDDLNEIEMDMKKATRIIRDITRGLLTDKCIAFLLFLVCAGVVAIIVIKIIKPNWSKTKSVVGSVVNATTDLANSTGITSGVNSAINNINTAVNSAASGRHHRLRRQLYFFDRRLLSELAMTLLQEAASD